VRVSCASWNAFGLPRYDVAALCANQNHTHPQGMEIPNEVTLQKVCALGSVVCTKGAAVQARPNNRTT
jgi:hypothetical protein